jgi:hypothetical protein
MRAHHLTKADVELITEALRDRVANARRSATGYMPERVTNKAAVAALFARQAEQAERLAGLIERCEMLDAWLRPD